MSDWNIHKQRDVERAAIKRWWPWKLEQWDKDHPGYETPPDVSEAEND